MFEAIKQWWATRQRTADGIRGARVSAESAEDRIAQRLGPAPTRASFAYKRHLAGQEAELRLEELRGDLAAAEERAEATGRPMLLILSLLGLVGIELVGVLGVLRGLDVPPSQRLFAGAGVLVGTVAVTLTLALVIARAKNAQGAARVGWILATVPAVLLYVVVVGAFVATRVAAAEGDRPLILRLAEGIVVALATASPPWALKLVWARLTAARAAWGVVRRLRGESRKLERQAREAERGIVAFEHGEAVHSANAARIRAEHALARRELEARRGARKRDQEPPEQSI